MSANTDWNKIRIEYITTNASYRELADKYGVSRVAIGNKGKKEGWVEQRKQHLAKTLSKTLDKDSDKKSDKLSEITDVSKEILLNIKEAAKLLSAESIAANPQSVRHLTGALKDLKEIMCLKGELELKEQKARLAILEKQVNEGNKGPKKVVVAIAGGDESWTK